MVAKVSTYVLEAKELGKTKQKQILKENFKKKFQFVYVQVISNKNIQL